ncbi:MAG: F0F1 ATP synthase subunit epsilon, partial [Deltaproteobacteria bacterium]|nr:F0F1 ATP synthase subunit epsilon [Deltaproteobacteria bacterium]
AQKRLAEDANKAGIDFVRAQVALERAIQRLRISEKGNL